MRTLTTVLAFVLVMFALAAPNALAELTPGAFLRVPVEGVLGVAVLLVLPSRARRVAAVLAGVVLGLLAVLKAFDIGFFSVLDRPFDPLYDWGFVAAGVEFLDSSAGRAGAIGAAVGAAVLAGAVVAAMVLSTVRLTRVAVRHGAAATGGVTVLGVTWLVCTLVGAQIVPGVPVATLASGRLAEIRASLLDQKTFAGQIADDPFHGAPADRLLTALRGKDVVIAFVESYGRSAVTDPRYAAGVGAVLAAGTRRLDAAGFSSRSAFLTSPTTGGGSWLAHSTLLSGLWVNSQQRYDALVKTGRLTLNRAFQQAGWRTVGVMPGITRAWPEGEFFGYDHIYTSQNLGYRGPRFNWGTMPDQYTLNTFQHTERAKPDRKPVMAEIPLVSSHAPWAPVPHLTDWHRVGDGSTFKATGDSPETVWQDSNRVRTEYRRAPNIPEHPDLVRGDLRRRQPGRHLPGRPPAGPHHHRRERRPRRPHHPHRPRPRRDEPDGRLALAPRPQPRPGRPDVAHEHLPRPLPHHLQPRPPPHPPEGPRGRMNHATRKRCVTR
ncbi:sulfatase [Sphaerisporangium sp. B11E5]|uniref:sulfatase n=1 Tax=Sphaerisporangium sp. B11E5 TaxID=3153563 RepID=UPI00325CCA0F